MAEEFLSAARRTYRTLSEQLGLEVFSQRLILRQTQSPADREAARHRLAVPGSGRWLRRYDEDTLEIRHGGQVDIPGLIGSMRAFLEPQGCWSARSIRPEELVETPAGVETDGFRASVAVLAVGWRACEWSHANALPWTPAKGVMIDLECALSEGDAVRIASHWVAPVSGGRVLRCGATFERDFGDLRPSDRSRLDLESSATELLRRPVVTRQILVGVRPIAQDRKPVLGALSTRSRIVHFNGLGSRGALQGPYWARHLARSLVLGEPLARDVAATRFLPR
jgi:glycine/D-amino acid oxidase-like deaminating enzyme